MSTYAPLVRIAFGAFLALILLLGGARPALADPQTYIVTNTNDSGAGSLRQAILDANANPGIDLIHFNIPAPGIKTISPLTQLPDITEGVVIDGLSQPGASCADGLPATLLIELDGSSLDTSNGLRITGNNSAVSGLVINRFNGRGIQIENANNGVITCNYIGTDPSGDVAQGNSVGIALVNAPNTVVGLPGAGNIIAGSPLGGVVLSNGTTGAILRGNYIGTNPLGAGGLGNYVGVDLRGAVTGNTVGGTQPGDRNILSGNTLFGVYIWGYVPGENGDNIVQGNYIGVDPTGTTALPNQSSGIELQGTNRNLIGGDEEGAGNLISGNGRNGIFLSEGDEQGQGYPPSSENRIIGNTIGLNAAGDAPLPNLQHGIHIFSFGEAPVFATEVRDNLVSGNRQHGIKLDGELVQRNTLRGNRIGVDATGLVAIANNLDGIHLDQSSINTIGGFGPGVVGNLIAGNGRHGIYVTDPLAAANVIQDNTIGLNADGASLGNGGDGIRFESGGPNLVGGVVPGMGNTIAYNVGNGVGNRMLLFEDSTGIAILGNSIFANGALGIDLFAQGLDDIDFEDGVTENDPLDEDTGPNNYQNYPSLDNAASIGDDLFLAISLNSAPNRTYRVELFASGVCDASGHGEGRHYLDFSELTTDETGFAILATILVGQAQPPGTFFTATTTDPDNNTSEFSECLRINLAPVAEDDEAATDLNTPVLIDVLANDSDQDGDPLTITQVTDPANGTAAIQDGQILYSPVPEFLGIDIFTYTISDGNGGTDSATVTVTVGAAPANNAPIAVDDEAPTIQDTPILIDVLANDSDPDNDPLTITAVSDPANGAAVIQDSQLLYTPAPAFVGSDIFTYTISDGNGGTDSATVTVTVGALVTSSLPIAVDDFAVTSFETPILMDVLANDLDPDGDPLTLTAVGSPANGVAAIQDGQVLYTPNAAFVGADTFSYTISDEQDGTDEATVTVQVLAPGQGGDTPDVNDPPVAVDDTAKTLVNAAVGIGVLTNDFDPDGDPLIIESVAQPANGGVVVFGGIAVYTPNTDFVGLDVFAYTISDPQGLTATATVSVTVAPLPADTPDQNDPPVAIDDAASTQLNTAVFIPVRNNDFDPDDDPLTITLVGPAANGSTAIQGGQILYTPAAGFTGFDFFVYQIGDGNGGFATAQVLVHVGLPAPTDLPLVDQPTAPLSPRLRLPFLVR
mgnify:CR=1 FL=1